MFQMENLLFLGVPILHHIMVVPLVQKCDFAVVELTVSWRQMCCLSVNSTTVLLCPLWPNLTSSLYREKRNLMSKSVGPKLD